MYVAQIRKEGCGVKVLARVQRVERFQFSTMDPTWRYSFWSPYPGYVQPPAYGAGTSTSVQTSRRSLSHDEHDSLSARDLSYELGEEDEEVNEIVNSAYNYFYLYSNTTTE